MNRPVAPLRRGEDNVFCEVATTANVTLANEQTVDGVALISGDYVLVWKQTDITEHGVYQVRDGGDWYFMGQIGLIAVRFGSSYKESMFALTETDTYKQVSGAPAVVVVRLASTANVTTSGAATIDGTAVATDDLVLLKNQTTAADRAVWKVSTAGAWTKQTQPAEVIVRTGTVNGGGTFYLSTTNTYTALGAFVG